MRYEQLKTEIKTNGIVYINTWSQDCDGVEAIGHRIFTSIEEFNAWEEGQIEWAEGPFGWEITNKDNLNESYSYGGWSDY